MSQATTSQSTLSRAGRVRSRRLVLAAVLALCLALPGPAAAVPGKGGFMTSQAAMLMAPSQAALAQPGVSWTPLITVGEMKGNYRFEAIPDGISVGRVTPGHVDIYVNHETSTVAFPYVPTGPTATNSSNDFDNAQLSHLVLNRGTAGILKGDFVIPSSANYQRFCSNFLATAEQGFDREILFTNEEATDFVSRTGTAWPVPAGAASEQAGVVVAFDVKSRTYKSIYGMGRHNHENSVAIPGYEDVVLLSGDDTFSAPASQLYSYIAPDADAVWNDEGHLWAFKSDVATINDYGDLGGAGAASVSGTFILVPDGIADGPQTPLETWSNEMNVFQFIRVEDIAYDRTNPKVVYIVDTGEPRAKPGVSDDFGNPPRLLRSPTGGGPYPNGRVFKMVLDPSDPKKVTSLSVLIDADAGGYNNPLVIHQPDNIESTANSLLIQEDPGSHQAPSASFPNATNARIWRYALATGALTVVAEVDQSLDGGDTDVDGAANANKAAWESSGIVDASAAFGPGTFLVDVQAHSLWVEKGLGPDLIAPAGADWTNKREGGQLLLLKITGG